MQTFLTDLLFYVFRSLASTCVTSPDIHLGDIEGWGTGRHMEVGCGLIHVNII